MTYFANLNVLVLVLWISNLASCHPHADEVRKTLDDETHLYFHLLDDHHYVKELRPSLGRHDAVVVSLRMNMTKLFDLDAKNHVLHTNFRTVQIWEDPRLVWNASDYNDVHRLQVPVNKIWHPDLSLYNRAEDQHDTIIGDLASVDEFGIITWASAVTTHSHCVLDLTYFPYDQQICTVLFRSATYDSAKVKFKFSGYPQLNIHGQRLELQEIVHPEWRVVRADVDGTIAEEYFPCCSNPFSVVSFSIKLQRQSTYYKNAVIGPCVLLALLIPVMFLLPPGSTQKPIFGCLLLVGLILVLILIDKSISYSHAGTPSIVKFCMASLILTTLSVVLGTAMVAVTQCGPRRRPIPELIRTIFLGRRGLRRLLCFDNYAPVMTPESLLAPKNADFGDNDGDQVNSSELVSPNRADNELREILRNTRVILLKTSTEEHRRLLNDEWYEISRIMDRLLFVLFFALILIVLFTMV